MYHFSEFYSWTYTGTQLDLNPKDNGSIFADRPKQQWELTQIMGEKHNIIYPCCPDAFPDVTFYLQLNRHCLFYVMGLIFPCILLYSISFIGFYITPGSGDKINLEVTILLALIVFLIIVSDMLPPVPDDIPLLGITMT